MIYVLRSNNYLKQHGIPMFRKPVKNKGEYRKWFNKKQELFAQQTIDNLLEHVEKIFKERINRKAKEDS